MKYELGEPYDDDDQMMEGISIGGMGKDMWKPCVRINGNKLLDAMGEGGTATITYRLKERTHKPGEEDCASFELLSIEDPKQSKKMKTDSSKEEDDAISEGINKAENKPKKSDASNEEDNSDQEEEY